MIVSLEEAQAKLVEIIDTLQPGESVVILRNTQPVARLTAIEPAARAPRQPGNCQGLMTIVADDDEHLQDFAEYLP